MKILFVDSDQQDVKAMQQLLGRRYDIRGFMDYKEAYHSYLKMDYDILIVASSNEKEEKERQWFMDEITRIHQEQRVITLVDARYVDPTCADDCIHCKINYRRRRLEKPVKLPELINYIEHMDHLMCKHTDLEGLKHVLKRRVIDHFLP